MKKILFIFSISTFLFTQQAEITNIQASQRTDGSQIVDITYDLLPDPVFEFFEITVFVSLDGGENYTHMSYVSGDLGDIIEPGNGKTLMWNFGQQFGETYSDQIKIKIEGLSYALVDNNNNQELPFEMVTVAAGEYTFGENDETRTIDYDYEIMKYEVTDQDYVLYMLDVIGQTDLDNSCQACVNSGGFYCNDGINWDYNGSIENCILGWWYCDGGADCNDGSDEPFGCSGSNLPPQDCGESAFNPVIYSDRMEGYYPGDSNYPAGYYSYINFGNSKISWNGEIFEVEEGNVNHPVTGVTWFGAWAFATYYGMKVPNQYEWEKAARGNTGYDYPWGDSLIEEAVQYNYYQTNPVGYYNGDSHIAYGCLDDNNCGELITISFIELSCNWQINNNYTGEQILGGSTCDDFQYLISPGDYSLIIWDTDAMTFTYQDISNTYSASGQPFVIPFTVLGDEVEYETYDAISPLGTYDMAGNVWEIVKNDDDNYFIRGGAYNSDLSQLQSWHQESYNGLSSANNIGFRCIRVINQSQSRIVPKDKLKEYYINKKNNTQKSNLKK